MQVTKHMGGVNFLSPSKKLAAREVLVLATEDDCFGRLRVLLELSMLIAERPGYCTEGFEDVGAVMGEATPGAGPISPKCHYSPSLPNEKSCKKLVIIKHHFVIEVDILGLASS